MSDNEPNTPAMDALMNAVYYLSCRERYDERIGKNDEFVRGGVPAILAYYEKTVDVNRPTSAYMRDVYEAARALQAEARTQVDGALW